MHTRTLQLVSVLCLVLAGGCASVHPPKQQSTGPTVPVYVVDYGIHTAIILPDGGNGFVEYSFGDFNYATADKVTPAHSFVAAFFSSGAGFGRHYVPVDPQSGVPVFPRYPKSLQRFDAPTDRVDVLAAKLKRRFEDGKPPEKYNQNTGILWRRDSSEHYTLVVNNCNHLTRRCLRDLGFEVRGVLLHPTFKYRTGEDLTTIARKVYEGNQEALANGGGIRPPTAAPSHVAAVPKPPAKTTSVTLGGEPAAPLASQ